MNPKCPHCGEESLRATVTVTYTNVPLATDGYSCMEGTIADDEISRITCMNCKKEVPVEHYYEESPNEPSNQTRTDPLPF